MTGRIVATCAFFASLTVLRAATISIGNVSSTDDVTVDISGVTDLYAYQFDIGFDPTLLEATGETEGPFLSSGGGTTFVAGAIDNSAGTLSDTADSLTGMVSGVTGLGTLATIDFQAIGVGTSPITLSNILLLDSGGNSIPFMSENGSVTSTPEPGFLPFALVALLLAVGLFRRQALAAR
jgi:adhesin HecA-like repeat protein